MVRATGFGPICTIRFLGGAGGIGASCAAVDLGEVRVVIDCGVRLHGDPASRLPDLALLEEGPPPAAILVTHAHLDHIGALPLLHQRFPGTPIHATPPTIDLMRVQLLDALRIMESESEREGEVPLYSRRTVESLLERAAPVTPECAFELARGGPHATFFLSGHILGACAVGIESEAGRVLFTGDVSIDRQRTIPGMAPPRFRPHLVVCESTYGNRLHASRAAEETRLAATVAEVVAAGGKVLVPAFAVGRAQEVILVLQRAMRDGRIPRFPVFVDGLVRRVCEVYRGHQAYVAPALARAARKHGDPFFDVVEEIRAVGDSRERSAVLAGPPCAVVASSGMLTGGASAAYAAALLDDPASLIAITGYQDEEAPGRRLLEAAEGTCDRIAIGGVERTVRCRIEKYALSAHADGSQIAALLRALGPSDTLLVHGDGDARRDLAGLLARERLGRVHLPRDGEERRFFLGRGEARAGRRLVRTGIAASAPAADLECPEAQEHLARHLLEEYPPGTSFSTRELYQAWIGREPRGHDDEAAFEELLRGSPWFVPDRARPFLFLARDASGDTEAAGGPMEANRLVAFLESEVPPGARLLRKSFQPGVPHMVLHFAFPDRAAADHGEVVDRLFEGTGWTYELNPRANPAELAREIEALVPDRELLARNPSARIDERHVTVWLREEPAGAARERWHAAVAAIEERTGFAAELRVRGSTPAAKAERNAEGRLEVNLAYARIDEAFAGLPHRPYRKGMHPGGPGTPPRIVLSFITPEIGERHRDRVDALERELGWPIEVSSVPNQCALLETARELLDGAVDVARGPSYLPARRAVRVVAAGAVEGELAAGLAETFRERTGWELVIE